MLTLQIYKKAFALHGIGNEPFSQIFSIASSNLDSLKHNWKKKNLCSWA